jgi:hypothetical protein
MIAIEFEAPIVNHRIDVSSDRLPSNVRRARIIVMYEEESAAPGEPDIVALARAARASFPRRDGQQLRHEFAAMRSEGAELRHGK